MKSRTLIFLGLMLAALSLPVLASSYLMRIPLTKEAPANWQPADPVVTEWVTTGGLHSCDDWLPQPESVDFGQSYLQSRTCLQDETRQVAAREYNNMSGQYRTTGITTDARSLPQTQSRSETGTFQNWVATDSVFTAWENAGEPSGYSEWSPAPSTEIANYDQTRTFSQTQQRTEQPRERDEITGNIRNVGEPIIHTQALSQNETRTVTVASGDWGFTGDVYGCSAWAPATSTVNTGLPFTQTQSCSQDEARVWQHIVSGESIHNRTETRPGTVTPSRPATGTKVVGPVWGSERHSGNIFTSFDRNHVIQWLSDRGETLGARASGSCAPGAIHMYYFIELYNGNHYLRKYVQVCGY